MITAPVVHTITDVIALGRLGDYPHLDVHGVSLDDIHALHAAGAVTDIQFHEANDKLRAFYAAHGQVDGIKFTLFSEFVS